MAAVSSDVHPKVHPFTTGIGAENRASSEENTPFLSDDSGTGPRGKKTPSFRSMNVSSTPGVSGETSKQKRQSSLQLRQIGIEIPSTAPATAAQGRSDQTRVSASGTTNAELFGGGANVDTADGQFTVSTSKNKNGSATDARVLTDGQSSVGGMTESVTSGTDEAQYTSAATIGTNNQAQLAEDAEVASRTKSFTGAKDLTTLISNKMGITDPEKRAQLERRLAEILAGCGKRLREENLGVMSLVHVLGDVLKWQADLHKEAHEKARLLEGEKADVEAENACLNGTLTEQAESLKGAEETIQRLRDEKVQVEAENARLAEAFTEKTDSLKEAEAEIQRLQGEKAHFKASANRFHLKDAFIGAFALFGHMVVVPRVWDAILGGESAIFRQHLGGIWIFMCLLAPFAMTFVTITKKGSNDTP